MPNAVHLTSHAVQQFKNQTDPDAAEWSFQETPPGDPMYWVTDGSIVRVMNAQEIEDNLEKWQKVHTEALVRATWAWGNAYTPPEQQTIIKHEFNRTKQENRVNAAAELQPAIDFDDALVTEYRNRREQIRAATTHDEVFAVSTDFSNIPHPPLVSVADAKATVD